MQALRAAAIALIGTILVTLPAEACRMAHHFDADFVTHADAVVVGRISDYEIVPRERDSTGVRGGYARFQVTVREALVGNPPRTFALSWDNSTFSLPARLPPDEYVIALRAPGRDASTFGAVLQQMCSPPFLLERDSEEARAVLERINRVSPSKTRKTLVASTTRM